MKIIKLSGIVRKIDELGRIVIPVELRRTLHVDVNDAFEIYTDDERVYLKKYTPACVFCHSSQETSHFKRKIICKNCLYELLDE